MRLAIIGGTGIDEMSCFSAGRMENIQTCFGAADVIWGSIGSQEIVFVPRHGLDHSISPSRINYRAQIAALKKLNVEAVIGVCAVGSLRVDIPAGSFVVLSDFIDLTKQRAFTFFDSDDGPVVHTDFTHPYCPVISETLSRSCEANGVVFRSDSVYVGVEGPRYETPMEIRLYSSWGGDVIGMTNLPEVILAREAGLCYGAVAIATNLASGLSPTPLSHDEVRAAMATASEKLNDILIHAISTIPQVRDCRCGDNNCLVI